MQHWRLDQLSEEETHSEIFFSFFPNETMDCTRAKQKGHMCIAFVITI